jgi:hypothetical protein
MFPALAAAAFSTHQMWVLHLFHHRNVVQLDVEILIHALQRSAHRDVVLELDGDLMVDQCLEEAAWHRKIWLARALQYTCAYALVLVRGVGSCWWPTVGERGRLWSQGESALDHRLSFRNIPEEQHTGGLVEVLGQAVAVACFWRKFTSFKTAKSHCRVADAD